jgi:hypothetical protein
MGRGWKRFSVALRRRFDFLATLLATSRRLAGSARVPARAGRERQLGADRRGGVQEFVDVVDELLAQVGCEQ